MTKRRPFTAFYVEAALLLLLVAAAIAVLAGVFLRARTQSKQAGLLTQAVLLAQNAAEATAAADSPAALAQLLNETDNAALTQTGVEARYDPAGQPDPDGSLILRVDWTEADSLRRAVITVCSADEAALYTLETAVYERGAAG